MVTDVPVTEGGAVNVYRPSASVNPPTRSVGILTLAPTTGTPPAPVTAPLMVVPCACASAGLSPKTLAIARKREILPVIPIQHLAESEIGVGGVAYRGADPARSVPPATMSC